jgi:hypothetical protein
MKIHRKILSGILFSIAVLFCVDVNVFSNYNIQSDNTELATGINSFENCFSSDLDSSDDDQIDNFNRPGSLMELRSQKSIIENCSVLLNCSFSIWNPPKIS